MIKKEPYWKIRTQYRDEAGRMQSLEYSAKEGRTIQEAIADAMYLMSQNGKTSPDYYAFRAVKIGGNK